MSKTSQASLGNASLESPGRVRLGLLQRQTKPSTLSARQSAGSSLLPAARGATARPTRDSRCARRRRAPGSASLRPRRVTTLTFSHRSAHVTRHTVSQKKTRYRLGATGRALGLGGGVPGQCAATCSAPARLTGTRLCVLLRCACTLGLKIFFATHVLHLESHT